MKNSAMAAVSAFHSCHEGALQVVQTPNGPKARLVKDSYCDGLGACLGTCPTGALEIIERESDQFDPAAVTAKMTAKASCSGFPKQTQLRQWPVQLHLVPAIAPFLQNSDIVLVADCVPFAYPKLHDTFLKDRAVLVGCPKLDDSKAYIQKLTQIMIQAKPKSIEVVMMTVPCCRGLWFIIQNALRQSGQSIPVTGTLIDINGSVQTEKLQIGAPEVTSCHSI